MAGNTNYSKGSNNENKRSSCRGQSTNVTTLAKQPLHNGGVFWEEQREGLGSFSWRLREEEERMWLWFLRVLGVQDLGQRDISTSQGNELFKLLCTLSFDIFFFFFKFGLILA